MKVAHFGDTHIRNLKYHKEYRKVFSEIYETLKDLEVDVIVHAGDLGHTKTQISPEFVQMCSDFLKSLADIAPLVIIPGNHDGNLKNSSREDSITPIVSALGHPHIHYFKNSGEFHLNDDVCFNALSMFDEKSWASPTDKKKINIAVYHGTIIGCLTDAEWALEHGDNDMNIFEGFDYGMLGDIHRSNQALDKDGKIRYCGSTIQQNFAETDDKGFLLWDIQDKDSFEAKHYSFKNPKPFITVELNSRGELPEDLDIPENARVRLVSNYSSTMEKMRKVIDATKTIFSPESVIFINRSEVEHSADEITRNILKDDLRDLSVQGELIEEYLKDFQVEDSTLKEICELNKKYNVMAEESEDISRNIKWKLKTLEWDNLFNYKDGNSIDFSKTNGVVGIFGKNYSGKSSIVDSLLYTLFNTTSKNNRKNVNVINQNQQTGRGYVEIEVGNKVYTIDRVSEKYVKKHKGEERYEARTNVDFLRNEPGGEVIHMNGLDRNDTDKNIRKIFGTVDDFLLTLLASQLGSLSYIGEGSTRRKEILAKFLDLDIFEQKHKLAHTDAADLKGAIKKLGEHDYTEDTKEARKELALNEIAAERKKKELDTLKEKLDAATNLLNKLESSVSAEPVERVDIVKLAGEINTTQKAIKKTEKNIEDLTSELDKSNKIFEKLEKLVSEFDIDVLRGNLDKVEKKLKKVSSMEKEIGLLEQKHGSVEKKISLLKEVPCGSEFSHCKFIKDAYEVKPTADKIVVEMDKLKISRGKVAEEIADLEPDKAKTYIRKHDEATKKRRTAADAINDLQLRIEKGKATLIQFRGALGGLEKRKEKYDLNKDSFDGLEKLLEERDTATTQQGKFKAEHDLLYNETLELYKVHGSLGEKVNSLEEKKAQLDDLRAQYTSYDLYLKCMHSNGISYDIIKRQLPVINEEISKILANIVEFEVFFEEDGKKLDIMIKHPKFDARPIELGSGAEKTIAAMAIRLALIKVSTLPVGDIFILDEPATALDEDHMEGFTRLLDAMKNEFKTVLIISHLDTLKDIVDQQIVIEKDSHGYAHVNL
tara:strand:+ start:678 stop:3827 length:3150 start_codon:yes stop_codon:yes gene_type:complete